VQLLTGAAAQPLHERCERPCGKTVAVEVLGMKIRIIVGCLALLLAGAAASDASAANVRTYAPGSYVVYVDNVATGWVTGVAGGGVSADVVTEKLGASGSYPKKHPSGVKYEDISIQSAGLDPVLHEWVRKTLSTAQPLRKSGYFVLLDAQDKEHSRTTWTDGFISDFTFPELDGTSKDQARFQITISPAATRYTTGTGRVEGTAAGGRARASALLASRFQLTIAGIEGVTTRTVHVDPMSVRFKTVSSPVGEMRDYEKTAGQVDVSNLVFTVDAANAAPLYQWHQDFVVNGKNSDAFEKTGSITLLGADMKTVLYKLNMRGIGILQVSPDKSSTTTAPRVRAEAYVESVTLD
jgi:hypothetical protein